MKLLICGECPEPLTTVAQELNRMRSAQMRFPIPFSTEPNPPSPESLALVEHNKPAIPSVS
ncbi:MAG TPA: hypothetical protein VIH97_01665 [Candidatus Acidoferrales bacterium]